MPSDSDMLLAVPPSGGPAVPVRERPILFSAPMVRAILECRKTQTRRVVKPVRGFAHNNILKYGMPYVADPWAVWLHSDVTDRVGCLQECPYGVPGDRLWVREAWTGTWCGGQMHLVYAADGSERMMKMSEVPQDYCLPKAAIKPGAWVTPLFMPYWASRITLEITDVRVQRVQEISDGDAHAEGVGCGECGEETKRTARENFQELWDSINEKRGCDWQANPWVWCIYFRRIHQQGEAHRPDGRGASNL